MKREINFFAQMRVSSGRAPLPRLEFIWTPVALAAAGIFALWLVFAALNSLSDAKLRALGAEIGGVSAQADASAAASAGEVVRADALFEQENLLTAERLKVVFDAQPDDLSVRGASYEYPLLRLDCWSPRALCGADFAALLRESRAFSDVEYSGVTAADGGYGFSIALSLEEGTADAD